MDIEQLEKRGYEQDRATLKGILDKNLPIIEGLTKKHSKKKNTSNQRTSLQQGAISTGKTPTKATNSVNRRAKMSQSPRKL